MVMQEEGRLERGGRALERWLQDGDDDRPRLEVAQRVAKPLGTREGIELMTTLDEAGGCFRLVVGPQGDDQDVRLVGARVRGHAPGCRVDRGHPLLPELDAVLRDVPIVKADVVRALSSKNDVEFREPEEEEVVG